MRVHHSRLCKFSGSARFLAPHARGYTFKPAITSEFIPRPLMQVNDKVLQDSELRSLIDNPSVWENFVRVRETGQRMPKEEGQYLAAIIRQWAQKKGCTGYAHWFSPIRGVTHGEKLETFVAVENGKLIVGLSEAELFQTETDGSSYPNGGLRETHEAAAFMGWDTLSSPFVYGETLVIPSSFISWTGEALDQKTPLLRANQAANVQSLRLLRLLGDNRSKNVVSNIGWEQEFFVITRDCYLRRPDLIASGRTLFGQKPLRGQEASLNYFARMPVIVKEFIKEAKERMWELGISIDCAHNEVAPAQHEICPIYCLANEAVTQNILAMEVLNDIAYKRGLKVLFHEKPFGGINGTGKHTNWSLATNNSENLFLPGNNEVEQRRFNAFMACMARAVNVHGDVMRIGVSTSGNDHRLGAQEAPPAIFTLMMGKTMEKYFKDLANGTASNGVVGASKNIQVVAGVGDIKAASEDRNRTAPFPFCGNRFEFRAVGGNQHVAWPMALLTTAMAESIKVMCDQIESGKAIDEVIKQTVKENQQILFSGNNYDPKLVDYAKKHNIFHLKSSPEAYSHLTSKKNIDLFSSMNVFTERELHARKNILNDQFSTELTIEGRTLLNMIQTGVAPAVMADLSAYGGYDSKWLNNKQSLAKDLLRVTDELTDVMAKNPDGTSEENADYALNKIRPALSEARSVVDQLEGQVSAKHWPYPTYTEIVHNHH
eukprot:CAMPEP_0174251834 /NCGR_PEP_ID=MMETSP0439-20130205/1535_1 /TAXON_ID=0 /ORGANISM="Stereomyxa ramosa, Strain Chinc5" /LENGTH=714 /DNA_ID=CAMNT_0015332259 /DNA_START=91 /DNA_END=2235 /DNA_ORIENTATION=-